MEVQIGGKYRHYKGKEYTVLALATHSETGEKMIVYKAEYDDAILGKNPVFVRPYAMFFEHVELEGNLVSRFTHIS